jgi:hypothetical protein
VPESSESQTVEVGHCLIVLRITRYCIA